ncbi:hypothetical protein PHMEG_0006064 [Phytophthora megakarya]|uniref:Uncharacterized protein n=1 Tax=Phytophthora megakarya TaxID=4795 RepID=A0A225WQY8_9STRA|nr:hypothetical protein PHMEG_0006064 [Phytophthora megakarya]
MGCPRSSHDTARLELLLQSFIIFKVSKSNLIPGNICQELTTHHKRSQLLSCNSKTCATSTPYARRLRRGKLETCEEVKIVTLAEIGAHITQVCPPQSPCLTASMNAFARNLAIQGPNPSHIRNWRIRRFDIDMRTLPKLSTSQRYVESYKRHHLGFNDFHEFLGIQRGVGEGNVYAKSHIGNGVDEDPFILGITSKRLVQSAARDPSTFVLLHVEATFKLNSSYSPVVVIGVSVRLRTFYLLTLVIVSQCTDPVYVTSGSQESSIDDSPRLFTNSSNSFFASL